MDYSDNMDGGNATVRGSGMNTEQAAAALIIGSLLFLFMIRRGFRGVGAPGIGGVRIG